MSVHAVKLFRYVFFYLHLITSIESLNVEIELKLYRLKFPLIKYFIIFKLWEIKKSSIKFGLIYLNEDKTSLKDFNKTSSSSCFNIKLNI